MVCRRHILRAAVGLGPLVAIPAQALTPLPPCNGAVYPGGYTLWDSFSSPNGFVSYTATHTSRTSDGIVVLEHCPTGNAVVVEGKVTQDDTREDDLLGLGEDMRIFIDSEKRYTLKSIARTFKRRGIETRRVRLTKAGCACQLHFPERSGNRPPLNGN